MTAGAAARPGYGRLLAVPGFTALAGSALLSRSANRMWEVGLVLFVLERFHSASVAGLTVFLSIMPGLLCSPVTGALLDRYPRRRLIVADNLIAACALTSIAMLGVAGVLTVPMLLPIVSVASLTFPLSMSGTRSLFPVVIPRHLWDLGNAADSGSDALSSVAGPALVGVLVGVLGGAWATLVSAGVFVLAAAAVLRVPEPPRSEAAATSLWRAALDGLAYVLRNPTLRAVAVVMTVGNLGYGQLVVILPVLVLVKLGAGASVVGALWAVQGVATVASGLLVGRAGSEGRERSMMAAGFLLVSVAFCVVLLPGWAAVMAAMVLFGASVGPVDVALFALRQRRTDPAWFGRAFAVSMALNFAGMPVGSAMAGPLVGRSLTVAVLAAVGLSLVASALCVLLIPRAGIAASPARVAAGSGGN